MRGLNGTYCGTYVDVLITLITALNRDLGGTTFDAFMQLVKYAISGRYYS